MHFKFVKIVNILQTYVVSIPKFILEFICGGYFIFCNLCKLCWKERVVVDRSSRRMMLLRGFSTKLHFEKIFFSVSVWPFLAFSRTQRSSDLYLKRTPRARVWFFVIFCAHCKHTCNFCKSYDGYQFRSKLVLELPNGIR